MSYNSNLPVDTTAPAEIRENLRALKEDKIVDAATAVVADSAAKLTTARKISLEGDATGSTSFDGSADVTIQVDVLSADTVGGYSPNDLMPLGAIIMWSGSIASIPSKWALCNGLNGTPDLRDRFVVGAGSTYNVSAIGGEATHTLTAKEMPAHFHNVAGYAGISGVIGATEYNSHINADTNNVSSDGTTIVGGNGAHNNMPPYYALAYIMRIA